MRRIIVGFSGGVTSAWCAGWALENYPKDEILFVFHDTKEEHPDTYRFIREMALALDHPVIDFSDGRSVTEVFYDNNAIANNRMAFCSRILKTKQRDKFIKKLKSEGATEIVNVVGFSAIEEQRVQRTSARAAKDGLQVRFPVVENKVTKQQCADWCMSKGVMPSAMYKWSEHANCVGCVRGGKAYWLKVKENEPDIFEQRANLENDFEGHTILKDMSLRVLAVTGLKRKVNQRESISIGACDCGD